MILDLDDMDALFIREVMHRMVGATLAKERDQDDRLLIDRCCKIANIIDEQNKRRNDPSLFTRKLNIEEVPGANNMSDGL